jgi:phosphoserine phosphatase
MNALVKTILYIAFDLDNTLIQSLAHKREALYATLYRHVIKYEMCAFGDEFIKRTEELAKNLPGLVHGWQRYFGLPYSWTEKIYTMS